MKASELFEGENSSLRRTFERAVTPPTPKDPEGITSKSGCCGKSEGGMGKCGRGTRKNCSGAHCKCMQADCPEMHYVDCFEHYIHVETIPPAAEESGESSEEEWYRKVEPFVEEMKSRYPKEMNMDGLDPALTADIAEIVGKFHKAWNEEQKKNIGMLRQWLNEDRITDPKKMVTNKEIITWLSK